MEGNRQHAGGLGPGGRLGKRLLSYYGDDFTGSTDVLEALFQDGLRTVLFLEPPTAELLQGAFADADCFGVAGVGRSLRPEEMERELRPIFSVLKEAGAAVVHYKICSTFDSSPDIGSIGKAAEIGRDIFRTSQGEANYVPLLVGVPYLRRFTLFGNHFAAAGVAAGAGSGVYRLDRHPTMSRHPVTPMNEADLREHLRRQTKLRVSSFDILALSGELAEVRERLDAVIAGERPELLLFDAFDEQRLATAGQLMWEQAADCEGLFVIGSSGIEYALTAAWRAQGLVLAAGPTAASSAPAVAEADRLLVVSGSCSPATESQIGRALRDGYAGIRVPAEELLLPECAEAARERLRQEALDALAAGRSVILYSASGPQDESIGRLRALLAARGMRPEDSSRLLGTELGRLAKQLLRQSGVSRLVVAGGDTSGYVTRALGIYALECRAGLEPGAPLCSAYSHEPGLDGLELVLKGGQVGGEAFFEHVRLGRKPASAADDSAR
jgi:uncharacterized protein YgbK (DUF1537 family)